MSQAVVVTVAESDWALVLTLWRDQNGCRELTPHFIVPVTSETFPGFATNPDKGITALPTEHIKPDKRSSYLKTRVEDYIRELRRGFQILEVASPGLISNFCAAKYDGCECKHHGTIRFLCEGPKGGKVMAALRLVHFLADKYKLCAATLEETDKAAMHALTNQRW